MRSQPCIDVQRLPDCPGPEAHSTLRPMSNGEFPKMTSQRPYLLRALYAWITDNGMTPHLVVDATHSGVRVPAFAVSNGKIVLNIVDRAVAGLEMGNDMISFNARFRGVSHSVLVPVSSVLAIFALETGQLLTLPDDPPEALMPGEPQTSPEASGLTDIGDATEHGDDGEDGGDQGPSSPRRGGHLRVVK